MFMAQGLECKIYDLVFVVFRVWGLGVYLDPKLCNYSSLLCLGVLGNCLTCFPGWVWGFEWRV